MKKAIISLSLALAMCLSLCVPAFAVESKQSDATELTKKVTEVQIQAEIKLEEERIFKNVYEQLKDQDALSMMDTYKEILCPVIEMNIREKYSVQSTNRSINKSTNSLKKYKCPYGGLVTCISTLGMHCSDLYLDRNNSLYYLLDYDCAKCEDIITAILGYTPYLGPVFSGIFNIQTLLNNSAKRDIKRKSDGFAHIMNVYNPNTCDKTSVLLAWIDHPYFYADTSADEFNFTRFQYHDPWLDN